MLESGRKNILDTRGFVESARKKRHGQAKQRSETVREEYATRHRLQPSYRREQSQPTLIERMHIAKTSKSGFYDVVTFDIAFSRSDSKGAVCVYTLRAGSSEIACFVRLNNGHYVVAMAYRECDCHSGELLGIKRIPVRDVSADEDGYVRMYASLETSGDVTLRFGFVGVSHVESNIGEWWSSPLLFDASPTCFGKVVARQGARYCGEDRRAGLGLIGNVGPKSSTPRLDFAHDTTTFSIKLGRGKIDTAVCSYIVKSGFSQMICSVQPLYDERERTLVLSLAIDYRECKNTPPKPIQRLDLPRADVPTKGDKNFRMFVSLQTGRTTKLLFGFMDAGYVTCDMGTWWGTPLMFGAGPKCSGNMVASEAIRFHGHGINAMYSGRIDPRNVRDISDVRTKFDAAKWHRIDKVGGRAIEDVRMTPGSFFPKDVMVRYPGLNWAFVPYA